MSETQPTNSSVMEHVAEHCQFVNPVNLYLIFAGAGGLILNVFPLCVVFNFQQRPSAGRDILIAALCIIDLLTLLVPLPIYLSVQDECVSVKSEVFFKSKPRPWVCEMFFLMFIWLKLSAMFLVTVMNYSSYLALNVKGQYREGLSIGDRLSNSFFSSNRPTSRESRINIQKRSSVVIANLVIGIALVAFVISSLPYLGLGPKGRKHSASNSTRHMSKRYGEVQLCQLEQISLPLKGKEYTFLFAVLMSSAACLILHLVHSVLSCFSRCFWNKNLKQAQELDIQVVNRSEDGSNGSIHLAKNAHVITNSYAKMTFFTGIVYFATWIPLMVAMGTLMSDHVFSGRFSEFALVGTFGNQFLDPIIYAVFIEEYRKGYAQLFGKMFTLPRFFTEFVLFTKKKQRALTQEVSEQNTPMNHP